MTVQLYRRGEDFNAFAGGFLQFVRSAQQNEFIEHQKRLEREARQKRNTAIAASAIAGGFLGAAVAPAAGIAAAGGGGLGAGGLAATAVPAGLSSIASGALTGASVGASLGDTLAGGDAGPFIQAAQGASRQLQRGDELAAGREFQLERDAARATARQQQQLDAWSLENYGVPYQQANESMQAAAQKAVDIGPQAGEHIGDYLSPSREKGAFAFGPGAMPPGVGQPGSPAAGPPSNAPGPSPIPGMERSWGPQQYGQLARLEEQRRNTIDNPEWVQANGPQVREAARQALARQYQSIRPTTRPAQPKEMVMSGGKMVPLPVGSFVDDYGNMYFRFADGSPTKVMAPPKDAEARRRTAGIMDPTLPRSKWEPARDDNWERRHKRDKDGNLHKMQPDGDWDIMRNYAQEAEAKQKEARRKRIAVIIKDLTREEKILDKKGEETGQVKVVKPTPAEVDKALQEEEAIFKRAQSRKLRKEANQIILNAETENKPDDEAAEAWLEGMIEIYGDDDSEWPEEMLALVRSVGAAVADAHRRGF